MGCVQSDDNRIARLQSKEIDKMLRMEKGRLLQEVKMLLLGAGESGKSTIVKQMKIIHQNGFSDEEKRSYKPLIYDNVISAMADIIKATGLFGYEISHKLKDSASNIVEVDENGGGKLTPALGETIRKLWEDSAILAAYERSSEYQLIDSAQYYFDNIVRVSSPEYTPNSQDILRARVKTTGIVETDFEIDNVKFRLVDVGGQRNERKKWIHCFQDVTAVLFVVALSEYDQKLYEDDNINRVSESLRLFDEISNSRWFADTSIILFLNKLDLFEKKIKRVNLNVCFHDYDGGDDLESAKEFMAQQFITINRNPKKKIYYHFTTATDTTNVRFVFNSARDIILRQNLENTSVF